MDPLTAAQTLGISLPSPAYIFASVLFGLLGFAAFRYGKKAERPLTRWLGLALMLYPYVVTETWMVYAVGAALCFGIWIDSR